MVVNYLCKISFFDIIEDSEKSNNNKGGFSPRRVSNKYLVLSYDDLFLGCDLVVCF